ncbi:MAG: TIM barrel protein, partial [Promethearchaeota archaeon]
MKIGAHMFITGGLYKSIEHGEKLNCETIQIFTKSNRSWDAKPLTVESIDSFLNKCTETHISPIFAHNTYLINLCAIESEKFQKSYNGLKMELDRAEQLQLPFTILHPGSHMGAGEEKGLQKIAVTLRKLISETEGYNAVQYGFGEAKNINSPRKGQMKELGNFR